VFLYRESASILSKESGMALENDLTLNFKKNILTGKWEKSMEHLELMKMPKECFEVYLMNKMLSVLNFCNSQLLS